MKMADYVSVLVANDVNGLEMKELAVKACLRGKDEVFPSSFLFCHDFFFDFFLFPFISPFSYITYRPIHSRSEWTSNHMGSG